MTLEEKECAINNEMAIIKKLSRRAINLMSANSDKEHTRLLRFYKAITWLALIENHYYNIVKINAIPIRKFNLQAGSVGMALVGDSKKPEQILMQDGKILPSLHGHPRNTKTGN